MYVSMYLHRPTRSCHRLSLVPCRPRGARDRTIHLDHSRPPFVAVFFVTNAHSHKRKQRQTLCFALRLLWNLLLLLLLLCWNNTETARRTARRGLTVTVIKMNFLGFRFTISVLLFFRTGAGELYVAPKVICLLVNRIWMEESEAQQQSQQRSANATATQCQYTHTHTRRRRDHETYTEAHESC